MSKVPLRALWPLALIAFPMVAFAATNTRVLVDGGISEPVSSAGVRAGFGLGAGIEAEARPRLSMVFGVEIHSLTLDAPGEYGIVVPVSPGASLGSTPGSYSIRERIQLVTTTLGLRAYAAAGPVRPYFDAGLGVRLRIGDTPGSVAPAAGEPRRSFTADGPVGVARAGVSFAPRGAGGFFAEMGCEFALADPRRDNLVPLRVGIALP
jgi:hypothetical protein